MTNRRIITPFYIVSLRAAFKWTSWFSLFYSYKVLPLLWNLHWFRTTVFLRVGMITSTVIIRRICRFSLFMDVMHAYTANVLIAINCKGLVMNSVSISSHGWSAPSICCAATKLFIVLTFTIADSLWKLHAL